MQGKKQCTSVKKMLFFLVPPPPPPEKGFPGSKLYRFLECVYGGGGGGGLHTKHSLEHVSQDVLMIDSDFPEKKSLYCFRPFHLS